MYGIRMLKCVRVDLKIVKYIFNVVRQLLWWIEFIIIMLVQMAGCAR